MIPLLFLQGASNEPSEALLKRINGHGVIHLVPSKVRDVYFLRMAVCSRYTNSEDIRGSWEEVRQQADEMLAAK